MMNELVKKINLLTILAAILFFTIGWQVGQREIKLQWQNYKPFISIDHKQPPQNINVDFKLFWETWDLVSREYLDKKAIDPQKLMLGAISGMVQAIGDPYTVFLPPEQQQFAKEDLDGSFEGVGIQLGFNEAKPPSSGSIDKRLVVVAPLAGTPAEKAGIKPQDMIIKIEGKDTTNMTLPEAVKLIRGPKDTLVSLTIYREGEKDTRDLKLKRDTIIVKSVELDIKKAGEKKIALFKLSRFGERTRSEWNEAVSRALSEGIDGTVLDLRNNPGGFLDGAVFITSEFLDGGDVVLQENADGQRTPFKVNRKGKLLKQSMVVLINKGSASASEIVAGALQDRKRATLVGEKSFGKGTIQESQKLKGGTGIHITVAKWLTPNSTWVNKTEGLSPDIEVKALNGSGNDQDNQLKKALEILEAKNAKT